MPESTPRPVLARPGLPRLKAKGLLFLADTHLADPPPGQRLEGYADHILAKVETALGWARAEDLVPVILGDLFHFPRENPNRLLVALMRALAPHRPWVLVGNHDKHQDRFTEDVSLAVLAQAGAVRPMAEAGPQFELETSEGRVLVGASAYGQDLPQSLDRADYAATLWCAHHGVGFPDYRTKRVAIRHVPGLDWVVNGHLHSPQATQAAHGPAEDDAPTRWANVGATARLTFTRHTRDRKPRCGVWTPGCPDLDWRELPHLPFAEVFPDQELPELEVEEGDGESRFLLGLERLAWRRTQEGLGLKQFLDDNLDAEDPADRLVLALYEEVTRGQ